MQLEVEYDDAGVPVLKRIGDWNRAIASIESAGSGGYKAVGPVTKGGHRAYGKHQVMDFNIGPWTQEVLGRPLTPQQFLNDKNAQDAVFNAKFGQYVQKYGNPQDAASTWFTGRPLSQGGSRRDILGTSGHGYVNKFNAALGAPGGVPGSPMSAGGPVGAPQALTGAVERGPVAEALLSKRSQGEDLDDPGGIDLPGTTTMPMSMGHTRRAQALVGESAQLSPQLVRQVAETYGLSMTEAANLLRSQ